MENTEFAKVYDPSLVEEKWYPIWEDAGAFLPKADDGSETFTVMIPPPNVTGILHIGHILNNTVQDVLVRRARMQGKRTLWLPGTDHASIATEAKVTKMLKDQGMDKREIGRDEFLKHAWQWKDKYGGTILKQLKKMGASCDWSRTTFTMDEDYSNAVLTVFVQLYNEGLIYRGERIINWDPVGLTALSDEEVIHKESNGNLWHFKYPVKDSDEFIIVATTRPETMLGDTGVAVNPKDERYSHLVGKKVLLPIVDREIPIFADDYVDMEFGTGCVKVTPAHDPNDFMMGERNNLDVINIMHPNASLNENAPEDYRGLDRYEARKKVVADIESLGLLEKIEEYVNKVGHSERTDAVVEPYMSKQWFVRMEELAKPALKVVNDGEVKFHPERWTKTYNHWLENIKDWCISRQLWWGQRIPVFYCDDCNHEWAMLETTWCSNCESTNIRQDEDVLDTWFSSWLWPFATLGWPEDEEDVNQFYPTQDLVTGPDIIFFWVARMIMAGLHFKDEIPFSNVYFTGLVRDEQGRKMSKSLGNSPDPLDLMATHGADALRVGLLMIAPQGLDLLFSEGLIEQGRNFMNKLWNSARFVQMNVGDENPAALSEIDASSLDATDKWILSKLNRTIQEVDNAYANYRMNDAVKLVYDYVYNNFCDWYIEFAKARFYGKDELDRQTAQVVSVHVLKSILKLLHPYTPYITEELWSQFKSDHESMLIVTAWPTVDESLINDAVEGEVQLLTQVISRIRNVRASLNISPGKRANLVARGDDDVTRVLQTHHVYLDRLVKIDDLQCGRKIEKPSQSATAVVQGMELFIPLADLIDIDDEVARLEKQISDMKGRLGAVNGKLGNANFVARAPEDVVANEKRKQAEYKSSMEKLQENLKSLKG
ncbi:MAG: valine--tRNA ligase [Candidatus Marinimicrobia bacterium]|nr:valine--tRNA ligase [Candidatus Neomarinimicrobiota bacterium]